MTAYRAYQLWHDEGRNKGLELVENIKSLQLGMHWFPERPGGLDRFYHSLIQSLPGAGVDVRGLVAGNGQAERDTDGKVKSFAAQDASLLQRMIASRAAVRQEMKTFRPDVVAIHFAIYAASGMRTMGKTPKVMHFHGP